MHVHSHRVVKKIKDKRTAQTFPQRRQAGFAEERMSHVTGAGKIDQGFGHILAGQLHHFRPQTGGQLQIVLQAALYGGVVTVDGVEPHGTRFTVTFPRAAADDAPETQKEVSET